MKHAVFGFWLFAGAAILAPASALAAQCKPLAFGALSVRIADDTLIAEGGGKVVARHQLPVVGSAWRCLKMRAFPKRRLLFVEWHGGEAGTSQMFHKISLLAFTVKKEGFKPRGAWALSQGYRGRGPEIVEADRTYRLEESAWSVNVVLEGLSRIPLETE